MERPQYRVASAVLLLLLLSGCGGKDGYKQAFSPESAPKASARVVVGEPDQIRQGAIDTLVKNGFTLGQVGTSTISAARAIADKRDEEITYRVAATVSLSPTGTEHSSIVSLSANQKTLQYTVRGYVVRSETTIVAPEFYSQFFDGLDAAVARIVSMTAARPQQVTPPAATAPLAVPALPLTGVQSPVVSPDAPTGVPTPIAPPTDPGVTGSIGGTVPVPTLSLPVGPTTSSPSGTATAVGAALGAGVSAIGQASASATTQDKTGGTGAGNSGSSSSSDTGSASTSSQSMQNAALSTLVGHGADVIVPALGGHDQESKPGATAMEPAKP